MEFDALGVPWSRRGARMEEQVEPLRLFWREPVIDYTGKFHRVERAGILPLPARSIPIWYGAFAPVALARAVRTGDGLFFAAAPSRVRPLWDGVVASLREAGRAVAEFGSEASVDFSADPDSWSRELEIRRAAGGTHLSLRAMDTASEQLGAKHVGYRGPQDYIDALRKFRDALGFGRERARCAGGSPRLRRSCCRQRPRPIRAASRSRAGRSPAPTYGWSSA